MNADSPFLVADKLPRSPDLRGTALRGPVGPCFPRIEQTPVVPADGASKLADVWSF